MAPYLSPPNSADLLPPLLACLPTAFASPKPPPALLDLLSPILRQRVQILSDTPTSSDSSWLPLLCWDSDAAVKLASIIESGTFEPHPVSGEIEIGEVDLPTYKRLDDETLQSKFNLRDLGLETIFLWCEKQSENAQAAWKLSELRPPGHELATTSNPWLPSVQEANEKWKHSSLQAPRKPPSPPSQTQFQDESNDDEDDYWARYDSTPARTPAAGEQHALPQQPPGLNGQAKQASEDNYFERYGQVQPAMDSDNPSTAPMEFGLSSLDGNEILSMARAHRNTESASILPDQALDGIVHTRPSSSSSPDVAQLEDSAQRQSSSELGTVAVQQHISTSIKSLFRLAKVVGMDRGEFDRLVRTELGVLSMLEDETD